MDTAKLDIQAIFNEAITRDSEESRVRYLDEVCANQPEVRKRIEALLQAHSEAGGFFGGQPAATVIQPIIEKPGAQIGPYKLLQQLGEGGMGVVYMAEQTKPVERRVALKIIKPGMDTQQVVARFEAERQALAMMDHPNIAKVLDVGTTESGRPYFVMELVKGMPVTQYCDEQQLTPKERLELFVPICQAVQHAHQKGIIHRDLKPSNILVARYDDKAVPKIIDFGVAKAVSQRLTEKTMFTQYGQIVGTIEYMSPEQAQFNQLDVDTRSDVYSLGVLLYELLTGDTPFDKQRLRSAAFDELLRIIREEEPPRPSVKLSTSETLPSVAASRHIEPHKLSVLVRGELDWIVMKAMDKDRSRRYETASSFAADVQHYLNDEAVVACPPSASYRFRKFARRNRAAIITTAIVTVAVIVVAIGSSIAAVRFQDLADEKTQLAGGLANALDEAERNLNLAKEQEQIAQQNLTLANRETKRAEDALTLVTAEQQRAEANLDLALAALDAVYLEAIGEDKLLRAPISRPRAGEATMTSPPSQPLTDAEKELLKLGLSFYHQFAQRNVDTTQAANKAAHAYRRVGLLQAALGDHHSAETAFEEAVGRFKRLTEAKPRNPKLFVALGNSYRGLAENRPDWPSAKRAYQKARDAYLSAISLKADDPIVYFQRANISELLGDHRSRLSDLEHGLELDPENTEMLREITLVYLWSELAELRDRDKALKVAEQALALAPDEPLSHIRLAQVLMVRGKNERALKHHDRAIELAPNWPHAYGARGLFLRDVGRPDEAIRDLNRALEIAPKDTRALLDRGYAHHDRGDYQAALQDFEAALRIKPRYADAHRGIADCHLRQQNWQAAADALDRAIAIDPSYWILHKRRAIALFHLGVYKEALIHLKHALAKNRKKLNALVQIGADSIAACSDESFKDGVLALADEAVAHPDTDKAVAHQHRARLRAAMKRPDAIEDYTWLIENQPRKLVWRLQRGRSYQAAGNQTAADADFDAYLKLYDEAIGDDQAGWQTWNIRGIALTKMDRWDAALADFDKAHQLAPDRPAIQRNRKTVFLRQSRWTEAADAVKHIVELDKASWRDEYELALLSLRTGEPTAYRNACKRMLTAGAETTDTVEANFIAWTVALAPNAVEDYDDPLAMASMALESAPGNYQYINTLGAVLFRAGKYEAAMSRLSVLAVQLDNSDAVLNSSPAYCWYFLAMTHDALGQRDEARTWLGKANDSTETVLADEANPPAWNRRLTLELLRDGATALIGKSDETGESQPLDEKTSPPPHPGEAIEPR